MGDDVEDMFGLGVEFGVVFYEIDCVVDGFVVGVCVVEV